VVVYWRRLISVDFKRLYRQRRPTLMVGVWAGIGLLACWMAVESVSTQLISAQSNFERACRLNQSLSSAHDQHLVSSELRSARQRCRHQFFSDESF
jgi:hypothetical protein